MPKSEGLTPKQEHFCLEYLKDFNATQAALRAGYGKTPKAAANQAWRLMREKRISEHLRSLSKRIQARALIDRADALRWARDVAASDIFEVIDVSKGGSIDVKEKKDIPKSHRRAVMEISRSAGEAGDSVKVRMHQKTEAIKLIFNHLRLVGDDRDTSDDDKRIDQDVHRRLMATIERIKRRGGQGTA